jgi:hypothetical protein
MKNILLLCVLYHFLIERTLLNVKLSFIISLKVIEVKICLLQALFLLLRVSRIVAFIGKNINMIILFACLVGWLNSSPVEILKN